MRYFITGILLLLLLPFNHFVKGRPIGTQAYNIGKEHGLPDDHAYSLTVDRYGYLWITTPKGLVKYNGYTLTPYTMSHGLPMEDIWYLNEDRLGRVWLFNISNELGYIKEDVYRSMITTPPDQVLHPNAMMNFGEGIAFLTPKYENGKISSRFLYIVAKDTFTRIDLGSYGSYNTLLAKDRLVTEKNDSLYTVRISQKGLVETVIPAFNKLKANKAMANAAFWIYRNYIFTFIYKRNELWLVNLDNKGIYKLKPSGPSEVITYAHALGDNLYISSTTNIYVFDSSLNCVRQYPIRELCNISQVDVAKPCILYEDTFWGNCLSTVNKGVFINYKTGGHLQKVTSLDISGFSFVGCVNDSICYWWNSTEELLAEIRNARTIRHHKLKGIKDIHKISALDRHYSLLLNNENVYRMNNVSKEVRSFYPGTVLAATVDAVVSDAGALYGVSNGTRGFYKHVAGPLDDKSTFDSYKYSAISYDSARNGLWIIGKQRIVFYSLQHEKSIIINKDMLEGGEIKKVEQLLIDNTHGNILLKDYDRLLLLDPRLGTAKDLIPGYRFTESTVRLYNNTVIIVGRFGVLFSKIIGNGRFSVPIVYHNTKNISYNNVFNIQLSNNILLISSDKGLYEVAVPSDSALLYNKKNNSNEYKVLATYNGETIPVSSSDTISIYPENPVINFDVINPRGNGQLKFKYSINNTYSQWIEQGTSSLNCSRFVPGIFLSVSLVAYDDVWKSAPLNLVVTVMPYWWQTAKWLAIFTIAGFIFLLLMGTAIFTAAKKMVMKKMETRSHLMELELKSIYSQINPHFIFNTLGTSMFLVKMNRNAEAYAHINKFSRLLRTYLKSSRERLITVTEEASNLKDYIELQQSRFVDKFNYSISINERLDAGHIKIPSLLLQPIVENAIVHGLLNKEGNGVLTISFDVGEGEYNIVCIVEDNGIGREKAKAINNESSLKQGSFGTLLIDDLVQLINRQGDINIDIQYVDKTPPDSGTIVKIFIKTP